MCVYDGLELIVDVVWHCEESALEPYGDDELICKPVHLCMELCILVGFLGDER